MNTVFKSGLDRQKRLIYLLFLTSFAAGIVALTHAFGYMTKNLERHGDASAEQQWLVNAIDTVVAHGTAQSETCPTRSGSDIHNISSVAESLGVSINRIRTGTNGSVRADIEDIAPDKLWSLLTSLSENHQYTFEDVRIFGSEQFSTLSAQIDLRPCG